MVNKRFVKILSKKIAYGCDNLPNIAQHNVVKNT